MVEEEIKFDPTKKEDWKLENADAIAQNLGFENTEAYRVWLTDFIQKYVAVALVPTLLSNLAIKSGRDQGLSWSPKIG